MAITFYAGSGSPFVWRVWLALEHKQLAYELRMLSFDAGDLKRSDFLAVNPRGKVPAIVDDGFALWESAAIVEYLEDRHPQRPLFPADVRRRAEVRRLIREADGDLCQAMETLVDEILRNGAVASPAIAEAAGVVGGELRHLEGALGDGRHWLAGELSAADFTVQPMLALVRRLFRRVQRELESGPRTLAWLQRVEALPCYAVTYPPHWR